MLTPEKEIAIGIENYPSMQQVEGGRLTGFPELSHYVQKIGHKLAALSDRPNTPYEFVILDNSTPNAWASS